ncbi:MAG: hypothetical protein AAFN41_00185 [Planctomycetota bacterium]
MNRVLALVSAAMVTAFIANSAHAQPEGDPLPTLDELLGLESDDDAPAEDAVEQELENELEQADAISDAFVEAVDLMSQSADRLADTGDTGVVTQRIQEDILKKLQQLIDDAQQGSGSSSSGSGSPQQSQDNQQQPNQQGQQQPSESEPSGGNPDQFSEGPAGQAAQPGEASMNAAAWGALPARLRDALLQGSAEGYSSMYRSLTEEYYRRLAEEASE